MSKFEPARRKKVKRNSDKDKSEEVRDLISSSEEKHEKKRKKKQIVMDDNELKCTIPTVSIAVAGSIIDNAQSQELATLLAGQIARAATIFQVDEVVVFDNKATAVNDRAVNNDEEHESGARFLVRILQYLETPQYLRRRLFPMHSSLKNVGLLPPLDAPHHVRKHEWSPFREGVTLEVVASGSKGTLIDVGLSVTLEVVASGSKGTLIDVGLSKNVRVEHVLEPGLRVTVAMGADRNLETDFLKKVVGCNNPREEMGLYWGYKVRYALNLSSIFKNCPYKNGYDYIIGTSEHGAVISSSELSLTKFQHLLIAFGGLAGLEESIEEDSNLKGKGVDDIFHLYLNTCPGQGSRTIRTEEAIFISLQYFHEPIIRAGRRFVGK